MQTSVPILDPELIDDIERAITMFEKRVRWKELGMDKLREQGAALLFHGPSGTGKTTTAKSVAKRLKHTLHSIDFSDVGSSTPGELARNIKKLFENASIEDTRGNQSLVLLDECDTMLVARSRLGNDNLWMLEPINALLVEIRKYRGMVILCTNMQPDFLDAALESRLLGKFHFDKPEFLTRVNLWKSKWPRKLPVSPTEDEWKRLAEWQLTGAEIEIAIIEWVSQSIREEPEDFNLERLFTLLNRMSAKETNTTVTIQPAIPPELRFEKGKTLHANDAELFGT